MAHMVEAALEDGGYVRIVQGIVNLATLAPTAYETQTMQQAQLV